MSIQPQRDILLARHTTFQLGGRARYFYEATAEDEVIAAIDWANSTGTTLHVLGGGSNLVVADEGLSGLVLKISVGGLELEDTGDVATVRANAGVAWDDVVRFSTSRGLAGIECLSGIPGSAGAAPIQNIGAYGQEVAQTLTRVTAYDRAERHRVVFERDECELGYRDSRFKSRNPERYVILKVEFELQRRTPASVHHGELESSLARRQNVNPTVEDIRMAILELRRAKAMLAEPEPGAVRSAGSFFVNPIVTAAVAEKLTRGKAIGIPTFPLPDGRVKLSAAWLIERAGLRRGERHGNVGLSPHHCLVLIAHERAEAREVIAFAQRIRAAVFEQFSITLVPEPSFWGFYQLDDGLPIAEETVPPTLGSASWPVTTSDA
jgi:UDP-N-acetylmuramate dehydrogenase